MPTLTYRLLDGTTEAVLTSPALQQRLAVDGDPAIAAELAGDAITFTSATAEFMLRARVASVFEDVLGSGWRGRVRLAP